MHVLGRVIALLPTALGVNLAMLLGILIGRLLPIRGRVVRANIDLAFGDSLDRQEKRRLFLEAYKSLCLLAVESAYLRYGQPEWILDRVVETDGLDRLLAAIEGDRPVISIGGHLGNWEMAGAFGAHKFPVTTLAKPLHNRLVQEDVRTSRERQGLQIIWAGSDKTNTNTPRAVFKAFRAGRAVHFFVDQDMGHAGVFVPYFGHPASTTAAPALIALKSNALIFPGHLIRLGPTRHRFVIGEVIDPATIPEGTREEQVLHLTQRITASIEDLVRLYPAQYFWFHRRWKTTPEAVARKQRSRARKREAARRRAASSA
ncbi:MAG: Kdo2-lipid lauroyltransferase/acyltransferase [Candidatus Sumerlaeota bacterium]|nr:Kdo2-lipid lauroyltransferase/acyltransferase [Candidatus Sumerlaeota bacterium]